MTRIGFRSDQLFAIEDCSNEILKLADFIADFISHSRYECTKSFDILYNSSSTVDFFKALIKELTFFHSTLNRINNMDKIAERICSTIVERNLVKYRSASSAKLECVKSGYIINYEHTWCISHC